MPDGPLFEVAVIHHTQCGAGALADDDFRDRYAQRIGADDEQPLINPLRLLSHATARSRDPRSFAAYQVAHTREKFNRK